MFVRGEMGRKGELMNNYAQDRDWRTGRIMGLLLVFALSGASGLIYQSIWSQYLGLYLGHAAYAQALVLAIFMGGMAVGSWLAARYGGRWARLLRAYALIEGLIGIIGLTFHPLFGGITESAYASVLPALGGGWLVYAYKWLSAALLILPQSILLGMTFPMVANGLMRRLSPEHSGRVLSGLYFTNSMGAALGVLAATFILLPRVGLPGTVNGAAWLNLLVMVIALLLSHGMESARVSGSAEDDEGKTQAQQSMAGNRLILLVALLTGASSFVYELVWVRLLSLAFGTTIHAFELMLAAFIAGLALGGWWIRRHIDRLEQPLRAAAWAHLWMGVAALISLALYQFAFDGVAFLLNNLARTAGGYHLFNLGTALLSAALMMPTAFFAGMTLPLLTLALLRQGAGEAAVGRVYASNTLGAIVGVFVAIAILIPITGLKYSMMIAALVDLALVVVLLRQLPVLPGRRVLALMAGVATLALLGPLGFMHWDPAVLASGVFRSGQARLSDADEILFQQDGRTSSVSVIRNISGEVRIATNGKADAGIIMSGNLPPTPDEHTMTLLAGLPLLHHRNLKQAAVIGFGSGMTTHVLLTDPDIERVDTLEIEPAMVDGARAFLPRVKNAYDDPRSHIIIEDAKSYFSGHARRYDAIISEPSNPWISGIGNLFSREFYQFAADHLNDEGVFVQWLQLYEIDEPLVSSVLHAMLPAFDDFAAYFGGEADLLIVASKKGRLPPLQRHRLSHTAFAAELEHLGMHTIEHVAARRAATRWVLEMMASRYPVPANSDYYPHLSLRAPRARFEAASAGHFARLFQTDLPVLEILDVNRPLPADFVTPPHTFSPPHEINTAMAGALAHALAPSQPEVAVQLPSPVLQQLAAVRTAGAQCQFPSATDEAHVLDSLAGLARRSTPFLPRQRLLGVWIKPVWLHCANPSLRLKTALDLLAAVARRDRQQMYEVGVSYISQFAEGGTVSMAMNEYAMLAAATGGVALGRGDEVLMIAQSLGGMVEIDTSRVDLFDFLITLAGMDSAGR